MAAMYIFPTSKFQIARIKLKILTHPSILVFCMFLRGWNVLNCKTYPFLIQVSTVSGQVLQFTSTYSEKYISTILEYTSTAFSSTYPIEYICCDRT